MTPCVMLEWFELSFSIFVPMGVFEIFDRYFKYDVKPFD